MMITTWRTRRRPWSPRRRARSRSLNTPPSKRLDLVQDGAAGVEQREPHDDHDLHDVSPSVEPRAVYRWPHLNHKSEALTRRVAPPWKSDPIRSDLPGIWQETYARPCRRAPMRSHRSPYRWFAHN